MNGDQNTEQTRRRGGWRLTERLEMETLWKGFFVTLFKVKMNFNASSQFYLWHSRAAGLICVTVHGCFHSLKYSKLKLRADVVTRCGQISPQSSREDSKLFTLETKKNMKETELQKRWTGTFEADTTIREEIKANIDTWAVKGTFSVTIPQMRMRLDTFALQPLKKLHNISATNTLILT